MKKNFLQGIKKVFAIILTIIMILSTSISIFESIAKKETNPSNSISLSENIENADEENNENTNNLKNEDNSAINSSGTNIQTVDGSLHEENVDENENKANSNEINDEENNEKDNEENSEESSNENEEPQNLRTIKNSGALRNTGSQNDESNFQIAMKWGDTAGNAYKWNAENKETRVIKLIIYYKNEATEKTYNARDLQIVIPGIGRLNRDKTLKAVDIAADEDGSQEQKRDWSYEYNEEIDMYTFYNNKEIQQGESFSGSFEILWQFNSRNCINGYMQDVQATLKYDGKRVFTPNLSIEYTSKKDEYEIQKNANYIMSAEGLNRYVESGKTPSDYVWIQYNYRYNIKKLNSRGVKNRYFIETFPAGSVIASATGVIRNTDGTISYMYFENNVEDTDKANSAIIEKSIIVGYPAEYSNSRINSIVELYGTYKDEESNEPEKLAQGEAEIQLKNINDQWIYFQGIINTHKTIEPERVFLQDLDKDVNFKARIRSTVTAPPESTNIYGIAITDDFLQVYTDDLYRIKDEEYEFTKVTLPGRNNFRTINGYELSEGNYTFKVKILRRQDVIQRKEEEYITVYEGEWTNNDFSLTNELKDSVAVRVEVYGLTESINTFYINVEGKININDSIENGEYVEPTYLRNCNYTDILNLDGDSIIDDTVTEISYSEVDTGIYESDLIIYGKGLLRSSDTIMIDDKQKMPGYYTAKAEMQEFEVDEEVENFDTKQTHKIEIENSLEQEISKIKIYGVNEKEELKTLIETLKFTYSNLEFKYFLSQDIAGNDENMQEYLFSRASIEKNGKEIAVTINFADNPIVAKKFSIGYTIDSKLTYEDFSKDSTPTYKITTYGLTEVKEPEDGSEVKELEAKTTAQYKEQTMAVNSISRNIIVALSSHQQLIKLIRSEYTGGEFENQAVVPLNSDYTYRLKIRNGYNTLIKTEITDILEHSELTKVNDEYPYSESEWYGKLKNVDTKYLESKGNTVKVYYSLSINIDENSWILMESHEDGIWQTEAEDVKAIKVEVEGEILENSIVHVDVNMKAPQDESLIDKMSYNSYKVNAEAVDIYSGIRTIAIDNLPSNNVEVRLIKKEYNLEITKIDEESRKILPGVEFSLYDEGGNKVHEGRTGILGTAKIQNLKEGIYTLKEEIVPEGYETPEDYTIIIENGNYTLKQGENIISEGTQEIENDVPNIKITIENKRAKGSITVHKIDEYLNSQKQEIPLQGIKFNLQDLDGNILSSGETNAQGEYTFENLPWGKTYVLKETETIQGYELLEEEINTYISRLDKDKTVILKNKRKTGCAVLTKEDEKDGTKLEGAIYGIYAENDIYNEEGNVIYEKDELIMQGTTNEEGKVTFDNLVWGDYYIKETETIYGYDLSEIKHIFTINAETVETIIEKTEKEKRSKAKLQLVKIDDEGNLLEGAEFTLFDKNGEKTVKPINKTVGINFTTFGEYGWSQNEDGTWQSENYNIHNSEAIMESEEFEIVDTGYLSFDWSVSSQGSNYDYAYYEIINEETGDITTGSRIYGTNYGSAYTNLKFNEIETSIAPGKHKIRFIYKKNASTNSGLDRAFVKNAKIKWVENIETDKVVKEESSDENGQLNIEEIEWGEYYIQETKVPEGYEENNTKYHFMIDRDTFLDGNNTISRVIKEENNQLEEVSIIKNNKIKGTVNLIKYAYNQAGEETTEVLPNAIYDLYLGDGTKVGEYTTDENGKITVNNLDWGSYYFQEIKAPEGYSISNQKIQFVVNSKNASYVQNLTAYDKQESGEIKINKTINASSLIDVHGNASFIYKILGKNENQEEKITIYKAITFSENDKTDVDEYGNITKSIVISDIENYIYEITEEENYRYQLEDIIPITSNSSVDDINKKGIVVLNTTNNKGEISFINKKVNNSLLSDSKVISNSIQNNYYLMGVSVRTKNDSYPIGTKITGNDLIFTLYYSGGQEETTEFTSGVTFDGLIEYGEDMEGSYIKNVECIINGKIFITQLMSNWIMPNNYFTFNIINSREKTIRITGVNSIYSSPSVLYIPSEYNGYKVEELEGTYNPNSGSFIGWKKCMNNISNVNSVVIADGVKIIGDSAFYDCNKLKDIVISDTITRIGKYAFYSCKNLTEIEIPESVTSIDENAFTACGNLTEIIIPNSVTSIGSYAFSSCRNLTNVTIGNRVSSIGNGVFSSCSSLKNIEVSENNNYYTSEHGVLYNKPKTELIKCPQGKEGEVRIPNTVTSICSSAFSDCRSLTEIEIPEGVTSIGNSAFYYCSSLTEITIPNSVTSIGDSVFSNCKSLIEIEIPEGVTSIGNSAFYYCSSLTEITIPNSVTSIGNGGFSNCRSLTEIEIPNSVTSIGKTAFYYCSSLTEIEIPGSVTSIGDSTFYYCSNLTSVTIGEGVTSIGKNAFYGCGSLTEIEIPGSVTNIGDSAFYNCINLTSVTIGEGVTSIGKNEFYNCRSLTEIEIPGSVTSIGDLAFYDCINLTSVTIGEGVTSIGKNEFYNCRSLTEIEIPGSVTSIGNGAFFGCSNLTSVTIGEGVTSIEPSTFANCGSLTEITMSNSVTSIGNSAFNGCSSLTTINYHGTEEEFAAITVGTYNTPFQNATVNYITD